jgi:hypothetical protein
MANDDVRTTDIVLVVTLHLEGVKELRTELVSRPSWAQPARASMESQDFLMFVFEKTEEIAKLMAAFSRKQIRVEPNRFVREWRNVRDLMDKTLGREW